MGWKGTVRSIGAAVRAAERDAKRRQRELERQRKQYERMQELEQAAYEVDVFENHIEVIQSVHKECNPRVDWSEVARLVQPKEPERPSDNEQKARTKLHRYKAGIIDRLFRQEERKRKLLTEGLQKAIDTDQEIYRSRLANWEEEVEEWKEKVSLAESLLKGDAKAKIDAIDRLKPFSEISNLGSSLSITVYDNGILEATVNVHGTEIVPNEAKSLMKSGKLSVKKMPKGRFNEIYQDYVCSCALRVANELFSALPDQLIIVTAVDDLLNPSTGHLEESPILSVAISRSTINSLALETIDPSESMSNFVHNMSFKKTKGFERVPRLDPESLGNV